MDVAETRGTCEVVDGRVLRPCVGLRAMLGGDYVGRRGKRKGLFLVPIFDGKAFSMSAAVLCSGEHSERGVVLNYCPFCGASIGHHLRSKDEAEEEVTADV